MSNEKEQQISVGKDFEAEKEMLITGADKKPKTLNEVWGIQKKSKFPATTEEEYRQYLKGLNKLDLQRECIANDLSARDNRDSMVNSLVKEFRRYLAECGLAFAQPKIYKETDEYRELMGRAVNDI